MDRAPSKGDRSAPLDSVAPKCYDSLPAGMVHSNLPGPGAVPFFPGGQPLSRALIWLTAVAGLVVGAGLYFRGKPEQAEIELAAYYLPHGQECTVLLDCSSLRPRLEKLTEAQTQTLLARRLIAELKSERGSRVGDAALVHLHAVYFSGVDNYGRPNFASRQTLFELSGSPASLRNLGDADLASSDRLRQIVQATAAGKTGN